MSASETFSSEFLVAQRRDRKQVNVFAHPMMKVEGC
jgi:hypothetical protein